MMKSKHRRQRIKEIFLRKLVLFFVGLLLGTCFAYFLYFFVIKDVGLSYTLKNVVFRCAIIFIVIGFVLTDQIPCIAILTVLEFGSNSGRRCALGMIIILVLAGPVQNMSKNGDSVIRVMTCFTELAWNITMIRKDILLLPLHHITTVLKGEIRKEQERIEEKAVEKLWKPLEEEIERKNEIKTLQSEHQEMAAFTSVVDEKYRVLKDDTEAEVIEKRFSKALSYQCQDIFYNASGSCRIAFQDLYDNCYNTVTDVLGWALCWPMDLGHVCDLISIFEQNEDCTNVPKDQIVPRDFGEQVLAIKNGLLDIPSNFSTLITNLFSVMNNLDEIGENEIKARKEFVQSKFDRWEKIVQKVLKAIKYHRKYLKRISYDNQYISSYFRKIDDRRFRQRRSHLLPLKNFEKADYITVLKFTLTSEERIIIIPRIFALGVVSSILSTIFVLDRIISQLLSIFRRDEDFLIHVQGNYVVDIHIEGKGTLAQILRNIVNEINVKYNVHLVHETKPCLPTIHKLSFVYIATAVGLVILIFILCFCEVLSRRMRHVVMDYFYKGRAKRRTLWLYNECLRRRATQVEIIKRKLMQMAYSFKDDLEVLKTIRKKFPSLCGCLKYFNLDLRQCLLCKSKGEFFRCPNCSFYFCYPCFDDMDGKCLYCEARIEMLELMNEKSDDEESLILTHGLGL